MQSILIGAVLLSLFACGGPKTFTKGEYDDPNRIELLDDKFNEADMLQMSDTITKSILACDSVVGAKVKPVVMVEQIQNHTEEHIDMQMLTDKIRTLLLKSKKVRFVNKQERGTLDQEYKYNEAGNTNEATRKKRGKQTGVDYLISGTMATNVQELGNDKFIYYKLTMNLTNTETSEIDCVEEREVRKKFRKRSVGL